tara:strand:- start:424 stop:633 length:210 start_codon:yes stop_codon:yes gene_type:complete
LWFFHFHIRFSVFVIQADKLPPDSFSAFAFQAALSFGSHKNLMLESFGFLGLLFLLPAGAPPLLFSFIV